jgi:hypothetical protein
MINNFKMRGTSVVELDGYHQTEENMLRKVFTPENIFAFLLCMLVILLIIVTADQSPQWIYQGF